MDDPASAALGQVAQRDAQTGYNDAGWDIWPTNYSRFISQIDPDNESVGLFRIGGTITGTSPIYSRFARSFEHASGRDAMYFKLDDAFYSAPAGHAKLIVVYYDSIAGSTWDLRYDAGAGNFKTAKSYTGTGSRTWIRDTTEISDAVMLHNGPGGADFGLVNTDALDDVFHGIEFERGDQTVGSAVPVRSGRSAVHMTGSTIHFAADYAGSTKTVRLFGLNGRVLFEESLTGSLLLIPQCAARGVQICTVHIDGREVFSTKIIH